MFGCPMVLNRLLTPCSNDFRLHFPIRGDPFFLPYCSIALFTSPTGLPMPLASRFDMTEDRQTCGIGGLYGESGCMAWESVPFVSQYIVLNFFGTLVEWFRYLILVDKMSRGHHNHALSCAP
ncbi:hypothetical protein EDB89DRAFT_856963 [Lactarius sanguifluus]|nr:hypothetical protein EDB89DRAFT_856963 [Lactarius sanguifluus]